MQVFKKECRQPWLRMASRADEQLCIDILDHPECEVRRSRLIHRDRDHTAIRTREKRCHPRCRIRPPQHNAVTFVNSFRSKLRSETVGHARDITIAEAHSAIPLALGIGRFAAHGLEPHEVVRYRERHTVEPNLLRCYGLTPHAAYRINL